MALMGLWPLWVMALVCLWPQWAYGLDGLMALMSLWPLWAYDLDGLAGLPRYIVIYPFYTPNQTGSYHRGSHTPNVGSNCILHP